MAIRFHRNNRMMTYKDYNFTSIVQIIFYNVIKRALSVSYHYKNLVSNNLTSYYISDIGEAKLLKYLLKKEQYSVNIIKKKLPSFKDIKKALKMNYLDSFTKLLLFKLKGHNKTKISKEFEYLALFDVNNKSMINLLNSVIRKQEFISVYTDENINRYLTNNKINLYRYFRYTDIFLLLKANKISNFKKEYFEVINSLCDDLHLIELLKLEWRKLYFYFYTSSIIEILCIERLLDTIPIKGILMASDSHKISRLFSIVCSHKRIKTTVVQHGTVGKLAFTPILADSFCAWGEIPKRQLIELGENEKKIIVTGNPKIILDSNRNFYSEQKDFTILVATNPIGFENLYDFMDIIIKSVKELNFGFLLKVRLHPGENNREFIDKLLLNSKINYEYDENSDVYTSIMQSNVIIVANSTIGIEVLACRKNLIVIDLGDNVPQYIPYREYNAAPIVKNKEELINILRSYYECQDAKDSPYNSSALLIDYLGSDILDNKFHEKSVANIIKVVKGLKG